MALNRADKQYLDRTRTTAEAKAFPPGVRALLEHTIFAVEDSWDLKANAETVRSLGKPFSDQTWLKEGTIEFNLPPTKEGARARFSIEYDSILDSNLVRYYQSALKTHPDKKLADLLEVLRTNYRRVKNVVIGSANHRFDLRKEIGPEWSVYVYAGKDTPNPTGSAFADPEDKLILSHQYPTSLYGLYALLHEAGHVKHEQSLTPEAAKEERALRKRSLKSLFTRREKRIIINEERTSDAFALSKLRRFFGPTEMEQFKKLAYTGQWVYHKNRK